MEDRPGYYVHLEKMILDLLNRVVSRTRTTLLDPPVPLELVQTDLESFRHYSGLHIEQAARNCVYRIAVLISSIHSQSDRRMQLERV
jgi:hypothetical protein